MILFFGHTGSSLLPGGAGGALSLAAVSRGHSVWYAGFSWWFFWCRPQALGARVSVVVAVGSVAVAPRLSSWGSVAVAPVCTRAKLLQSCQTLSDPMNCNSPGSSVHGMLQARILEWVALPSSRGVLPPHQGSNPHLLNLLHWQGGLFTAGAGRSPSCPAAGGIFPGQGSSPPGKPLLCDLKGKPRW